MTLTSAVSHQACPLYAGFADHKESIQVAYDQRQWGSHWPVDDSCPGFRDEALNFMGKCESVVHKLLECFAVGLGMPYDDFKKVQPCCTSSLLQCRVQPMTDIATEYY